MRMSYNKASKFNPKADIMVTTYNMCLLKTFVTSLPTPNLIARSATQVLFSERIRPSMIWRDFFLSYRGVSYEKICKTEAGWSYKDIKEAKKGLAMIPC